MVTAPGAAGGGHDLRLRRVVPGVQDTARESAGPQPLGEPLGLLNGQRADQNRTSEPLRPSDLFDDGLFLGLARGEDDVRSINPDHRTVGRNNHDAEPVHLLQFLGAVLGRARHPAQALVALEEVLDGDRSENLSVRLTSEMFFGFERRLQAVRPVPVRHDPTGELVDNPDGAVAHDVVDVAAEEGVGVERAVELGEPCVVVGVVEAAARELRLGARNPGVGQLDIASVAAGLVVHARLQLPHEPGHVFCGGTFAIHPAGDDQRHTRFVDEQGVGLVDEREVKRPVHQILDARGEEIAEVIEAGFLGGHVRDVGEVRPPARVRRHALLDEGHLEAEPRIERPHPLGVPARQVVVDREHVHAVARRAR